MKDGGPYLSALERFPRVAIGHLPTLVEAMPNLGQELGLSLFVKRDDCTGIGFGGNKVRQLEYYLGAAQNVQVLSERFQLRRAGRPRSV
ncbi:MAG: hypothetical protein ABJI43_08505 [Roseobacter sp.]|uniref:hypothetical protein n=1 Tax=Tateyamaria sp. TaxID=1929288 RepID=UPI00327F4743